MLNVTFLVSILSVVYALCLMSWRPENDRKMIVRSFVSAHSDYDHSLTASNFPRLVEKKDSKIDLFSSKSSFWIDHLSHAQILTNSLKRFGQISFFLFSCPCITVMKLSFSSALMLPANKLECWSVTSFFELAIVCE